MMLRAALLLGAFAALPAFGDDFQTLAPVTRATVYPSGATVQRDISVDLPQGTHRIMIPLLSNDASDGPPRISGGEGLVIGSVQTLSNFVTDPETVYSEAQRAAREVLDAAQDRVTTQSDEVERLQNAVAAAEAEVAFYRSLSGAALEELDPDALRAAGQVVATELARGLEALRTAKLAKRGAQEALAEAERAVSQAVRDFERLAPPKGPVDMLAITVDVPQAQTAQMQLEQLVGQASWSAEYDLDLNTQGAPVVEMARKIVVVQFSEEIWPDIALTLSTANPFAKLAPETPRPNLARIGENVRTYATQRNATASSLQLERDEPVVEEAMIVEDRVASVVIDGLSVTYDYPQAVTLTPDGGRLILSLDQLSFEAERFNRAAPRRDDTAFLMARFDNTRAEPLLPGNASIHRDGVFIGRAGFELVPAGGETELAFGALEGLRLSYDLLDNDTGDRGLLTTSSTRKQSMEFTVENLTSEEETVQTVFALPFSQQESLAVSVRARPAPDETDFEKRRSVSVWDLTLAPGQSQTVRVDVDLSWPEGQVLDWLP